ncbi:MAG: hypothetical protein C4301_09405, partial [Thermus sp.]
MLEAGKEPFQPKRGLGHSLEAEMVEKAFRPAQCFRRDFQGKPHFSHPTPFQDRHRQHLPSGRPLQAGKVDLQNPGAFAVPEPEQGGVAGKPGGHLDQK